MSNPCYILLQHPFLVNLSSNLCDSNFKLSVNGESLIDSGGAIIFGSPQSEFGVLPRAT